MTAQNIYAQIKMKDRTGQGLDLEKERHKLAHLFDQVLKEATLGQWTGSALKSDNSLVFYLLVNDEDLARDAIINCFVTYANRSAFEDLSIQRM